MVKRAVLVACNYPCKAYGLAGCVNDAFAIAEQLEAKGFERENVLILHDTLPGRRREPQRDQSLRPTRVNILQSLQSMIRKTRSGDVCFFSFSGYGTQVCLDHHDPEGLDEAILPTDFQEGPDSGTCVVTCAELHDILGSAPAGSAVTLLMDCDHATSVVDISGTTSGELIEGVQVKNLCGLVGHSEKLAKAEHCRAVWMDDSARAVKARPRFQAVTQVCDHQSFFPTRHAMGRSTPTAFCISAAGHGQTALEIQVATQPDSWTTMQHGILSWCFVQALKELKSCDYLQLEKAMSMHMASLKRSLPTMDQTTLLTFAPPRSDPRTQVLEPPPQIAAAVRHKLIFSGTCKHIAQPPQPANTECFPGSTPASDRQPPSSAKEQPYAASQPRKKRCYVSRRKKRSSCCDAGLFSWESPQPESQPGQGGSWWGSLMAWLSPAQMAAADASIPACRPDASPKKALKASSRSDVLPSSHKVHPAVQVSEPVMCPQVRAYYQLPIREPPQVEYPTLLLRRLRPVQDTLGHAELRARAALPCAGEDFSHFAVDRLRGS
ncbi:AMC9 [Symbiodinium natans]|uniref:AMC9 protein n=1 Tax=Symbiodinium natans TaxID=878477 RepID=A0A812ICE9_9DINO|nr:AMC9 [Symbiodinium natans]